MKIKLTTEQKDYLKKNSDMTMHGATKMYSIQTSGYHENILDIYSMLDNIIFTANQIAMDYEGKDENYLTNVMYGLSATAKQCKKLLPSDIAEFIDEIANSALDS